MWTKEQQEAIDTIGVNTTVSASAGAGKTAVLVARLMKRIIEDGISVDQIVSLTFTDAAAAEMKNRLMEALLKKHEEDPNNKHIQKQITLLPSANITTIHSFCLSLLKDNYYMLQINPDSLTNIITNAQNQRIQDEAFNYVLENYPKDYISDVLNYLSMNAMGLSTLKDTLQQLNEMANSTTDPEQFLKDSISIYKHYNTLDELPKKFYTLLWDTLEQYTKKLNNHVTAMQQYIPAEKHEDKHQWALKAKSLIKQLHQATQNQDYDLYYETFIALASLKHKTITRNKDYNQARDDYVNALSLMNSILYKEADLLHYLALNEHELHHLIEMAIMYHNHYQLLVQKMNMITFNDMETLTYRLLTINDEEVAKQLRLQYTDILVDEFQDTNHLQNQIIELIGNKNNIFRVGDVKQSIYRFRGAEPSIMQQLIAQPDSEHHKTIYLSHNFRSKHDIVEFNNHVFKHLMNVKPFNTRYSDKDTVAVGQDIQRENNKKVEIIRVNDQKDYYDDEMNTYNGNDLKSHYIAKKIVELYTRNNDQRWNRFTVLVNSHRLKFSLKKAFDDANIPYFMAMNDGFYTSKGVSTLVAMLKLIQNPSDKISLMALLKHLYGYSDEAIAVTFLKTQNIFDVANQLNNNLFKTVERLKKEQYEKPLATILNEIMNINNFYTQKLSKQERTNVDILYEMALLYDKSQIGIYGFLKEIEYANEEKTQEGSSISEEDNVVNVMTVHNSKGLQFDTVFYYSKHSNQGRGQQGLLIHPHYGLAVKSLDTRSKVEYNNLAHYLIETVEKQEELEEEMRKLYVALTRAQHEMYIVDTISIKNDELPEIKQLSEDLLYRSSYTNWLASIKESYPTTLINYRVIESFSKKKAPFIQRRIKPIHVREPYTLKQTTARNSFKPDRLDFNKDLKGLEIGTLVHNTIEKLQKLPWTKDKINRFALDLPEVYVQKLIYLSNDPFFIQLNQLDVYHEFPFIGLLEEERVRGIIDFLAMDDRNIYIVDFKTDSIDEKTLIKRYKNQLSLYKSVLSTKDKCIHAYLYSFHLNKFIKLREVDNNPV